MSTTTQTDTPTDATNLVDDAARAAEHAEASSLAIIRPEQQRFDENQRAILRQLGIEDATDGDLDLFFHVCRTTGLDPFRRQIYMIGRNTKVSEWVDTPSGGRRKEERFVTKYTIQTGIDGYRRNVREAAKTLGDDVKFAGPWFTAADDFHVTEDGEVIQHWRKVWPHKSAPWAARFVVTRNGEEFEGIAHFDEFVQTNYQGEPNSMWAKMPRNQIAKCAEALAYRRAYPDDLSGLILEDAAQPTIIDGDTGKVIQEGRPAQRPRPAPVTVDDILAEEVPVPDEPPAVVVYPQPEPETLAPETPAGDEDQGAALDATPDTNPSPAEPATSSEGAKPEPAQAEATPEPAPVNAEAKAKSQKVAAKRSTAPAADPDRPKSRMRAALEKRLFALCGDAGISGDKDRDGRLAVYRAVLENDSITSTDDLDDTAVGKVADVLYQWQQQSVLDDEVAAILSAAVAGETTAPATADAPTTEGTE